MAIKIDENKIKKLMKSLDLTYEEAKEMYLEDLEVDRMTSMKDIDSDLTDEQRKVKKESTKTGTRKGGYKFEKKTRKADVAKENFIEKLAEMLNESVENLVIVNKNNEISFDLDGENYSIKLIKHRKAKK